MYAGLLLENPCPNTVLTLVSPNVFEKPLTYNLRDPSPAYEWDLASLISMETFVDCGPQILVFTDEKEVPFDAEIFEDDRSDTPARFSVLYSEDTSRAGTYLFKFKVTLEDYPMNPGLMLPEPFEVTIIDLCDKPNWIQPPAGLNSAVIEY